MSINLSSLINSGGGSSNTTTAAEFHALRRTADGMLIYTLEDASSIQNISVNIQQQAGTFYSTDDYVQALPTGRPRNNLDGLGDLNSSNDKYQQYKLETKKIRYYINDDGNMVARLNANYTYTGPK